MSPEGALALGCLRLGRAVSGMASHSKRLGRYSDATRIFLLDTFNRSEHSNKKQFILVIEFHVQF